MGKDKSDRRKDPQQDPINAALTEIQNAGESLEKAINWLKRTNSHIDTEESLAILGTQIVSHAKRVANHAEDRRKNEHNPNPRIEDNR